MLREAVFLVDEDGDDLGWRSVTFTPPIPDELDDTLKSSNRKRAAVNSMTLRFPTQPKDYRQLSVPDLDLFGPLGMIITACTKECWWDHGRRQFATKFLE